MRFLSALIVALALPLAALAGTTNIPGRLIIQTDDSAPTCSTATGDGMLCVENAVELQSTCAITGNTTIGGTLTTTGATTLGTASTGDMTVDGVLLVTDDTSAEVRIRDTTAPGVIGSLATLKLQAYDDASAQKDMAHVAVSVTDATAGAHVADLILRAAVAGTVTNFARLDGSASVLSMELGLQHHNGTALPATCVVGEVFLDTNSDDCSDTGGGDGCMCICKSTNTWAVVINI